MPSVSFVVSILTIILFFIIGFACKSSLLNKLNTLLASSTWLELILYTVNFSASSGNLNNSFDAVVYNFQGQVVIREYNNDGQIDLSNLSTGVYFVEIRDGHNVMIEKVIVK